MNLTSVNSRLMLSQCGAVAFIENISAENLNMSEEEFNIQMGYVDGKTDADLLIESEEEELQNGKEKLHVLKVSESDSFHEV